MSLPLLVAVMVAAAAAGIAAERRWHERAEHASRSVMQAMLLWVLPPVYLVLVSRLHVDATLLGGLLTGYLALGVVGTLAWLIATRVLHLPRATVGALILAVVLANTGYFGLPLIRTVLPPDELGGAVAWDSLISGPMFFVVAFAIGAAFGPGGGVGAGEHEGESRLVAFLRNPLLWAAVLGLAIPWDAPDWAATVAQDVVVALLPLGFLVVGVQLAAESEHGGSVLRGPDGRIFGPELLLVLGLRLIVAPLIVVGVSLAFLGLPSGMLLQAAAPTGLNGMLVAHRFGLDLRPIAASIVWTTGLMTLGVVIVTAVG